MYVSVFSYSKKTFFLESILRFGRYFVHEMHLFRGGSHDRLRIGSAVGLSRSFTAALQIPGAGQ